MILLLVDCGHILPRHSKLRAYFGKHTVKRIFLVVVDVFCNFFFDLIDYLLPFNERSGRFSLALYRRTLGLGHDETELGDQNGGNVTQKGDWMNHEHVSVTSARRQAVWLPGSVDVVEAPARCAVRMREWRHLSAAPQTSASEISWFDNKMDFDCIFPAKTHGFKI